MFRTVLLLIATVTCLGLTACGQVPLSYQPTMANLETLKAAKNAPMNVGQFALAPGKAATMDQSVTARATTVTSPNNSSFALFLKDALTQELRAVGKFDPNSSIVVSGLLTKS